LNSDRSKTQFVSPNQVEVFARINFLGKEIPDSCKIEFQADDWLMASKPNEFQADD
jgi:hypothetical protein